MNAIILYFFCLVALIGAVPAPPARMYFPAEEDPYYKRFMPMSNANGTIVMVDLAQEEFEIAPHKAILADVTYNLYTIHNQDKPFTITSGNVSALAQSNFDPKKISLFITHGWNNNGNSNVNLFVRQATLPNYDINVFVVDWSGPANKLYISASRAVVEVGQFLGEFVNGIQAQYSLTGASFILVGHSLGAHVSGNAGAVIKSKVDHIVGMDPASPLFTLGNINNRLDPTDAKFVQIIHTNGLLLGFASSIGDADYFPNGGMTQPGCGLDLTGSCSHGRSYEYFAESLSRGPVFEALLCNNYRTYKKELCNSNSKSIMGQIVIDEEVTGDFFLDTNKAQPFGKDEEGSL